MLETLLVILGAALALWILGTTVEIARSGYAAIPTVDDWDRWITYLKDHYSPWWFFQQHFDHRLAAPKLLFAIDHLVFHARGWFPLVCSFCFQALTGIMLWRLAGSACRQSRAERLMQAAVLASCLFSGQQWINFVMPFQVQFAMVYCAAAAALFALWKSAERGRQDGAPPASPWIAGSIAMATVATYSMANGVLVWPVLLLEALWLRMPRRWIGALAAGTILIGASYFYHWHQAFPPSHHLPALERLRRAVIFGLAHMGSPVAPLAMLRDFAAIPGALLVVALVIGLVMLWRRRERDSGARATLVFYCVFIAGTSASIAYGRPEASLSMALEWRYLTPSYILWACMLLAAWPLLRRVHRAALYGALCAAILAGVAVHQRTMLNVVRGWAETNRLGETAVVDNVTDPEPWRNINYLSDYKPRMIMVMDTIDYLRNNNLTIFTEEWTHWPGIPLNHRFSIDHTPDACQGQFEQAMPVPSRLKPGWRATGWAWDKKAGRPPRYVVLADDGGLVAGVALAGFSRPPGLAALSQRYTASTWNGYVNGQPRPITAYVLEADEQSLCAIGTQRLISVATEVAFTELGPRLPDSPPEIAGAWVPDGYFKGPDSPGAPPVDGQVFGSFPDAKTGSIRFGPFDLDGHIGIAIPVVTGPDSHNLSIIVRDAVSKEVFAQMVPPPIRRTWWAWRPELPLGREITVEVFAEDKGSGWGQWLALGWPHALRQ